MKILTLLIIVLLSACATTKNISIPQINTLPIEQSGIATAAALSIDITPPPGLPMGGYSIMANKGQGFRTRLKARVIYINDGNSHATALIQTDLTAGSLLLHHMVATAVAEKTGLKPGDITITASHSHSAPANFFENDFYNKHMTSGKWLEEDFLAFTVQRISTGVIQAYEKRRPAKIATGYKDIYGYNRNRSFDAYLLNENIKQHDKQTVFTAVNPRLNMIRIDVLDKSGNYLPLAAFSSFSVHATAITPQVEVYNADLFAYAQKDLERAIKNKYQTTWPVVHALTTGTQGDMAPALEQQGDNTFGHFDVNWKQAKKIGQGIGAEAIELFESLGSKLTESISINTAVRELNIRSNNRIAGIELCKDAAIGSPVVGGAYERRTPWLSAIPFFKAGSVMSHRWLFTDGCQGNKSHAGFSFLQPLFEPKDSFPQVVLFQIITINNVAILPLPFEVTTEAGFRIKNGVLKEFNRLAKSNINQVWITGNANGYFGYTTTVEEYSQQNYEGGHTIYGRYSTPYLSAQLNKLTRDVLVTGNIEEILPTWQYKVAVNHFLPKPLASSGNRAILNQPKIVKSDKNHEENYISLQWLDVNPSEINFHEPLVYIEIQKEDHWLPLQINGNPVNDDGYDIEVRYLQAADNNMGQYEVRWYNPVVGENYRFVIAPRTGQVALSSDPFR